MIVEYLKVAGALFVLLVGVMIAVAPCVVFLTVIERRMTDWPTWAAAGTVMLTVAVYTSVLVAALIYTGLISGSR